MKITKKKSTKGRKKIVYSKDELERDPMVMLICGEMGVGKTYRSLLEIKWYMTNMPEVNKKGRKVLVFDVNGADYPDFKTVNPNYIKALTKVAPRRILPFKNNRNPMTTAEKKEVVSKILDHYKNGLVVLDDIDSYMAGQKGQDMIGALVTVRHKGLDMLLSHQSISKITTTEWEACTWLRLHHQVDDVTRYRDRIPKYKMVRLAQLIVNEQYELGIKAMTDGKLSPLEYKIRKSFFVYVNMREQKIMGCSRAAFIRACKRLIDQEEGKKIRRLLNEQDFYGKPIYKDRNAVIIKLISDYLRHHDSGNTPPS